MFNIEKNIRNVLNRLAEEGVELTPESLANEAEMAKVTIYRIFNRDDAKLSQLASLAKVLGVSIYETFEVEGEKRPELSSMAGIQSKDKEVQSLVEKMELLEDYNKSLKQHVTTLERELSKYHQEPKDRDNGGSQQIG